MVVLLDEGVELLRVKLLFEEPRPVVLPVVVGVEGLREADSVSAVQHAKSLSGDALAGLLFNQAASRSQ